jgi:hypothetical protein
MEFVNQGPVFVMMVLKANTVKKLYAKIIVIIEEFVTK